MADTLGTLVDKLTTVDLKMWNNQELLYEIRSIIQRSYRQTSRGRGNLIRWHYCSRFGK